MAREFQNIKPDGSWSNHNSLEETMKAARRQCKSGLRPYALTRNGNKLVRGFRYWVLRRLERVMRKGDVGDVYRIWGSGKLLFTCREVKPAIKIIDTSGNFKADRCWSWGKNKYPDCSYLGAYVCKNIAGSYKLSQHSYGNAIDFGRDNMDELWDLAHFLVSSHVELALEHVIVANRIWGRTYGWQSYGGQYHYHVHADFAPQQYGSCGVKG